jgi:hypothetical protein
MHIQKITARERYELKNLALFDPVTKEHDRLHPASIINKSEKITA